MYQVVQIRFVDFHFFFSTKCPKRNLFPLNHLINELERFCYAADWFLGTIGLRVVYLNPKCIWDGTEKILTQKVNCLLVRYIFRKRKKTKVPPICVLNVHFFILISDLIITQLKYLVLSISHANKASNLQILKGDNLLVPCQVPLVEQELLTLQSTRVYPMFCGVCDAQSLVFCVVFCRSLFVLFVLFLWPLYCLSVCPSIYGFRLDVRYLQTFSSLLQYCNKEIYFLYFRVNWGNCGMTILY